MPKIMIIEDNEDLRKLLENYLTKYGYQCVGLDNFDRVLTEFRENSPDLVLLDINLPSFDGFYWCRQIRKYSKCPIIFISAREGTMDQVMAIENGADDYITKPFSFEIVTAKVKSQLRRTQDYPEKLELEFKGKNYELSKKEATMIALLLERGDKVTSRDRLMEKMWDTDMFVDENTLNVYISRIRRGLKELGINDAVETIRGAGYRMKKTWEDNQ
ncbi:MULTISPECIES: response regulator transcription factor [Heyndrickxia]|uniref:response regulator transcription factor n=1 Tax=Heyndrickxia TaxID=2837504 RepID=UPI00242C45FD|nr:response regulator transcription factor [Heyndrickxia oleronia]MCI1589060.1 response regulator transcription factor [Heyndrickxia oleronia]MCI1611848.1 response regulator transcription factor [Heyndrickxia oleronia]MCI1743145.1 response regulator transcription factor [Heyndrickxia oleronia]MCI1759639.1 response regulator transcription factor [Heyndrickxia oleronia]